MLNELNEFLDALGTLIEAEGYKKEVTSSGVQFYPVAQTPKAGEGKATPEAARKPLLNPKGEFDLVEHGLAQKVSAKPGEEKIVVDEKAKLTRFIPQAKLPEDLKALATKSS